MLKQFWNWLRRVDAILSCNSYRVGSREMHLYLKELQKREESINGAV